MAKLNPYTSAFDTLEAGFDAQKKFAKDQLSLTSTRTSGGSRGSGGQTDLLKQIETLTRIQKNRGGQTIN